MKRYIYKLYILWGCLLCFDLSVQAQGNTQIMGVPIPEDAGSDRINCDDLGQVYVQRFRVQDPNALGLNGMIARWYAIENGSLLDLAEQGNVSSNTLSCAVELEPGRIRSILVQYYNPNTGEETGYKIFLAANIQSNMLSVALYPNTKTKRICGGEIPVYWELEDATGFYEHFLEQELATLELLEILPEGTVNNTLDPHIITGYELFGYIIEIDGKPTIRYGSTYMNPYLRENTTQDICITPAFVGILEDIASFNEENVSAYPCTGNELCFTLEALECPKINPEGIAYFPNGSGMISITNGHLYDHFQWKKVGSNVGTDQATHIADGEAVYYAIVSLNDPNVIPGTSPYADIRTRGNLQEQQDAPNFITSTSILQETQDLATISDLTLGNKLESTIYYDGLGRPMQSVITQAGPQGNDLVQPVVYDKFGRQKRSYLPYMSTEQSGFYKLDALTQQASYYNPEGQTDPIDQWNETYQRPQTAYPYAERFFEASPRARVLETIGTGKKWHEMHKSAKGDFFVYDPDTTINPDPKIWRWYYDFGQQTYFTQAPYAQGELIKTEVEDTEGKKVYQYINQIGQVVLKRVPSNVAETEFLETCYVYDDFGQLRLVIPPAAMEFLDLQNHNGLLTIDPDPSNTSATGHGFVDKWCFTYHYDGRGRLVEKKVPNAEAVYVVYDKRNQVVLTQDGNQRKQVTWTYFKYDEIGRPIITGLLDGSEMELLDRAGVQEKVTEHYTQNGGKLYELPYNDFVANISINGYTQTQAFPHQTSLCRILSLTYYDSYDINRSGSADFYFDTSHDSYFTIEPGQSMPRDFERLQGMVTVSKVRELPSDIWATQDEKWLYTTVFYDDRYRLTQVQTDNHLKASVQTPERTLENQGKDVMTVQYHFKGLVVKSVLEHRKPQSSTLGAYESTVIQQWSDYDFMGRVLKAYQKINNEATETLAAPQYNSLGQVFQNKVGNGLQTIDYQFNIRGWLTKINDADLSTASTDHDLFGLEIHYEEGFDLGLADPELGKGQYNGSVAGVEWQSALDHQKRGFAYKYDHLNRLIEARYKNLSNASSPETYDVFISYDRNGNIQSLKRYGVTGVEVNNPEAFTFGMIDDLQYHYKEGDGNQLIAVNDLLETNGGKTGFAGDFSDRIDIEEDGVANYSNLSSDEYRYDDNGNLVADANKGISSIVYNVLNLPQEVVYSNDKTLKYLYDASGVKLAKEIWVHGSLEERTDYVSGMVYEQKAGNPSELQFIHTGMGRALAPALTGKTDFTYTYYYTDHQGNMRMEFKEAETHTFMATMEMANASTEEAEFANVGATRSAEQQYSSQYSSKLSRTDNPVGPWKRFAVGKGDVLNVSTFARYLQDRNSQESGLGQNINLYLSLNPTYGNYTNDQGENITSPFGTWDNISLNVGIAMGDQNPAGSTVPNAYLRIIHYNQAGEVVKDQIRYVSSTARTTWEHLALHDTVQSDGYVEILVANESDVPTFFDNVEIQLQESMIVQESHFYPYGMQMKGIGKTPMLENRWAGYNGGASEKQKDLVGKGYTLETDFRPYDPQLGRFNMIDPLASAFSSISPYHFAFNNPVMFQDPTGLHPDPPTNDKTDPPINKKPIQYISDEEAVVVEADRLPIYANLHFFFNNSNTEGDKPETQVRKHPFFRAIEAGVYDHAPSYGLSDGGPSILEKALWQTLQLFGTIGDFALDFTPVNDALGLTVGVEFSFTEGISDQSRMTAISNLTVGFFTGKVLKVANRFRRIFRKSPEKGKGKGKGKSDKTSCFIAGTQVSTSEGEKNIEDIKKGDLVWAYEEETGQKSLKKVLSTSAVEAEQLILIYIAEEKIQATPDHPFYVKGKGYVEAGKLHKGDSLLNLNNNYLVIDKLIRKDSSVKVYNFVVEDYHSYFVSSQSILVHNGNPCEVGHLTSWENMTKAEKKAFRHSYDRHKTEIGLPNFREGNAEHYRQLFNQKVTSIRQAGETAFFRSIEWHLGVKTTVNRTEPVINGVRYFYYETLDGEFISVGRM